MQDRMSQARESETATGGASRAADRSPLARVSGDLAGGLTATLLTLPGAMSFGIRAYAALGPEYAGAGILAALLTSIVANAVAALFPAVRCQILGSRASTTAVVGAFVATLAVHPDLQAAGGGPAVARS